MQTKSDNDNKRGGLMMPLIFVTVAILLLVIIKIVIS